MKQILFTLVLIFSVIGCNASQNGFVHREGEPVIFETNNRDPEMNRARKEAQTTLDQFITALQHPKSTQTHFSVKAAFPYGGGDESAEHIWLSDISYQDGNFRGFIGNEPEYVTNLKLGQSVTVGRDQISDWMIIDENHLKGGFTIRVIRSRMTPEERIAFDKEFGVIIDEQ